MKNRRTVIIILGIILILINLLAFVVWFFIFYDNDSLGYVDLKFIRENTSWDDENKLSELTVERGYDDANITGFNLIFDFEKGSVKHFVEELIDKGEKKVIKLNFSNFEEGNLVSIKIVPVFDGKEGRVTDEILFEVIPKNNLGENKDFDEPVNRIDDDKKPCIPTKTCDDYVCGNKLSDGCKNILNCGCPTGKICHNGACVNETNAPCNDEGCISEGRFCEGNMPYECSADSKECLLRKNKTSCLSGQSCVLGVCHTLTSGTTTNITQYGITWYFDKPHQYGQFVNGDFWVVGPVNIINIDPRPDCSNGRHGTMINPRYGVTQGYDSRAPQWRTALCNGPQITANPGDTLMSSISLPVLTNKRYLKSASVLTIVDQVQSPDKFRPPYTRPSRETVSNNDKLIFSLNNVRWDYLPVLPRISGTPSISSSAALIQKVTIEHGSNWESKGTGINPLDNPYLYGRDISAYVSEISLQLMLDYSNEEKKQALVNLMQYGIDLYGIYLDGGHWNEDGGIFCGRKWPILFTGIMLEVDEIKSINRKFHEDQQTFYVSQSDIYSQPYRLRIYGSWGFPETVGFARVRNSSKIVEGINTAWMSTGILQGSNIIGTDGKSYTTIQKHKSSAENRPTTGNKWQEFWVLNPSANSPKKWEDEKNYIVRWFGVENDTEAYRIDGKAYEIIRVINNTHIELNRPYRGLTNNNAPFKTGQHFAYYGHANFGKFLDYLEYTSPNLGLPEWGIRHDTNPILDGLDWGSNYRQCCNANGWAGFILLAQAMEEKTKSKTIWNAPFLFDYQDRYIEVEGQLNYSTWTHSWRGAFPIKMWEAYRNNFGCRWTRDNPSNIYSNGHYVCGNEKYKCSWQASTCSTCTLVNSCSSYSSTRAKNYDPCGVC
jgi:hypothetical protein